jgi:hypothetical protein
MIKYVQRFGALEGKCIREGGLAFWEMPVGKGKKK